MTGTQISPLTHPWTAAALNPFSFKLTPHQNPRDKDTRIPCILESGLFRGVIALAFLPARYFTGSVKVISRQDAVKMRREEKIKAFEIWKAAEALKYKIDLPDTILYRGHTLPGPILRVENIRNSQAMKWYLDFNPISALTFQETLCEITS